MVKQGNNLLKNKSKNNHKKIGILGGTFDPPHLGHVHISKIGIKKIKLNKLIWLVTKKNPLKRKPHLDIKTRIKLSKKITSKEKKIFIHSLDNKVNSTNTFDILKYIKGKNKNTKLFFLIGADNLIKLHKWKKWKEISKFAKILVFARKKYTAKALNSTAAKMLNKKDWIYINSKKIDISSSLIRKFW